MVQKGLDLKDQITSRLNKVIELVLGLSVFLFPIIFCAKGFLNAGTVKRDFLYLSTILIFLLLFIIILFARQVNIKRTALDIPILVIIFYLGVNTLLSVSGRISFFGESTSSIPGFLFFLVLFAWLWLFVQFVQTRSDWIRLFLLFLISSFIVQVFFLLANSGFGFGFDASRIFSEQVSSFALFSAAVFLLSFGVLLFETVFVRKLIAFLSSFSSVVVLLYLGFIISWIILVVGSLVLLYFGFRKIKQVHKPAWIVLVLVFVIGSFFVFLGSPIALKLNLPTEIMLESGASWDLVSSVHADSLNKKLFGTGLSSFPVNFALYRSSEFNISPVTDSVYFKSASNNITHLLSELGWLGIIIFLSFTLVVFYFLYGFIKTEIKISKIKIVENKIYNLYLRLKVFVPKSLSEFFEYRKEKTDQMFGYLISLVVVFTIFTGIWVFVFFEVSLWWFWFFVLALLVSGLSIFGLKGVSSSYPIDLKFSPQSIIVFRFLIMLLILLFGWFFLLGIRSSSADFLYGKALSVIENDQQDHILNKAIKYSPKKADYRIALSEFYLAKANSFNINDLESVSQAANYISKSIDQATIATELDPTNFRAWSNLGNTYLYSGSALDISLEQARDSIKKASELAPSNYSLHLQLGNIYSQLGDYKLAEKSYQAAIKNKFDLVQAYASLSELYEAQGNITGAINAHKPIMDSVSRDPNLLFRLGGLLYNRNLEGDVPKAEAVWQASIQLFPSFSDALYSLGMLYEKEGRTDQALKYYQRVLDLNPGHTDLQIKIESLE